jgi:hypothetical protein
MAQYSSKDFTMTMAGTDVTAYLLDSVTVKIQAILEKITPMGASWDTHVFTGISMMGDIGISGLFDTTSGKFVDQVRTHQGATIACVITYGGTKTTTFSAIVESYSVPVKVGAMTRFSANLRPTGTVTEA